MQFTIEIKKHENKDYTIYIYEGLNYFSPVFSIKKPTHWNKCVDGIGLFLRNKGMINVFQKKEIQTKLNQSD